MFSIIWTYIRLNLFWTQWLKWKVSNSGVQPLDVAFVVDDVRPRNKWKMIHLVMEDDQTRSAREKTVDCTENKLSITSRSTDSQTDPDWLARVRIPAREHSRYCYFENCLPILGSHVSGRYRKFLSLQLFLILLFYVEYFCLRN